MIELDVLLMTLEGADMRMSVAVTHWQERLAIAAISLGLKLWMVSTWTCMGDSQQVEMDR